MNDQSVDRSRRRPGSLLVSVFLIGACQQPSSTAETTTSAEATTSGVAQTAAAEPTTAGVTTEAVASTTDGTGSGGEASGGEASGGGGSGGEASGGDASSGAEGECPDVEEPPPAEINPQVVEECDALCAHYEECGLKEHELCQMGCVAKFGVDHQECYEAGSAARKCLMAMTCDDLGEYLQFNEGGSCAQLLEEQEQACTCQSQSISGTNVCAYNLDCPYVPFRRIVCGQGTCKCYVGDEMVKTCPDDDTCKNWLDLIDRAESCCCMVR